MPNQPGSDRSSRSTVPGSWVPQVISQRGGGLPVEVTVMVSYRPAQCRTMVSVTSRGTRTVG